MKHTYRFKLRRSGTFAYHSHTNSAMQELRGLDGFLIVVPKRERPSHNVDKDYAMTLQQIAPPGEGELVDPFSGDWRFLAHQR